MNVPKKFRETETMQKIEGESFKMYNYINKEIKQLIHKTSKECYYKKQYQENKKENKEIKV